MTLMFHTAARQNDKVMIGLAGPSSSGKTMSALRIARGFVGSSGKIAVIDTENGRASHYADRFQFLTAGMRAPFSPAAYLEAIRAGVETKADVIIVDSMSHEHESQGGILEMHDAELQRMAGDDRAKREKVNFAAWIKPKAEHNKLVNAILQMNTNFIFCFRAKDKLAMLKNADGKQEPVSIGWQPICADRFEYECTALLILPPNSKGTPDLNAQASKVPAYLDGVFGSGEQLSEEAGRKLAAWARGQQTAHAPSGAAEHGGAQAPQDQPAVVSLLSLQVQAEEAATGGMDVLQTWFTGLGKDGKLLIKPLLDDYKRKAAQAERKADARAGAET